MEHPVLEASWDELAVAHPLAVLLCGHDDRSRICVGCIPDRIDVGTGELVVVREVEVLYDLVLAAEEMSQRSVVGNA